MTALEEQSAPWPLSASCGLMALDISGYVKSKGWKAVFCSNQRPSPICSAKCTFIYFVSYGEEKKKAKAKFL